MWHGDFTQLHARRRPGTGDGGDTSASATTNLSSAEIYDPAARAFSAINSMNSPRGAHSMTLAQQRAGAHRGRL